MDEIVKVHDWSRIYRLQIIDFIIDIGEKRFLPNNVALDVS